MTASTTRQLVRLDFSGATAKYVGKAAPGSATSAPSWFIKRLNFSSGTLESIDTSGTQAVWDDRSTETYT